MALSIGFLYNGVKNKKMMPVVFSLGKINFYSLGVFLAIGAFLSSFLIWRRLRDLGVKEDKVIDFLLAIIFFGLVNSRLVYIATHFGQFGLALSTWWLFGRYPGLSFWGALLGFGLVLLFFVKRQKQWSFWQVADELSLALLPLLILSQAGCFFDGCSLGKPTSMIWGIYLPGRFLRRQPVSLFATVALFLIWTLLLWAERRWRLWSWYQSKDGFISLAFLGLLTGFNFALAFWRDSPLYLHWLEIVLNGSGLVAMAGIFYWRAYGFSLRRKHGQKKQTSKQTNH